MRDKAPLALITGGARRLGAEIVRHLAAQGWDLLLHWNRSAADASALRDELGPAQITLLQADLTSQDGRLRLVDETRTHLAGRRLRLLVHNASIFPHARLEDVDDVLFDSLFALHVKAPLFLSRDLAPELAAGQGMVLTMLDAGAHLHWPGYLPYALSKQALREVTIALARELAPDIRVNGIELGFILPPENAPASYQRAEAMRLTRAQGSPVEVLKALQYLLGANFVTGEILNVDGGRRWIRPLAGSSRED